MQVHLQASAPAARLGMPLGKGLRRSLGPLMGMSWAANSACTWSKPVLKHGRQAGTSRL